MECIINILSSAMLLWKLHVYYFALVGKYNKIRTSVTYIYVHAYLQTTYLPTYFSTYLPT